MGPPRPSSLELITIGTELLLGFTVDTNSAHLGRRLAEVGLHVTRRTSVGDDAAAIRDAVDAALTRSPFVLTTGGLGPTSDDITKATIAELLGKPLQFDPAIWEQLLARFKRLGREPSPLNRSQAMVPEGATVLPNKWGTAPGLWIDSPRGVVVMLPGVPSEMKNLLEHEVIPRLSTHDPRPSTAVSPTVIRSATLRTTGIAESTMAERIERLGDVFSPLGLAYLPGTSGLDLRLTAWLLPEQEADAELARGMALLRTVAADWMYAEGDVDLAQVVLDRLGTSGKKLAVAESCTGGLIAERLTEIPGSSDVFLGGVVTYADAAKESLLGVPERIIQEYGAVSAECAEAMARGAISRFGADLAVAVTGIAGPGGGSEAKPVGLVWFGFASGAKVTTLKVNLLGSRREIRERAAQAALVGLFKLL